MGSQWRKITHTTTGGGREYFRIRSIWGNAGRTSARAQSGYNDAIATCDDSVYFGVGQSLKILVSLKQKNNLMTIKDPESDKVTQLYVLKEEVSTRRSFIATICQLTQTTVMFGSYPAGI